MITGYWQARVQFRFNKSTSVNCMVAVQDTPCVYVEAGHHRKSSTALKMTSQLLSWKWSALKYKQHHAADSLSWVNYLKLKLLQLLSSSMTSWECYLDPCRGNVKISLHIIAGKVIKGNVSSNHCPVRRPHENVVAVDCSLLKLFSTSLVIERMHARS